MINPPTTYFKLAKAREYTGSIRFEFVVVLLANAELNCEPVASSQSFDLIVRRTERSQANLLREPSETLVRQQRCVAKQFMNLQKGEQKSGNVRYAQLC